MLISMNSCLLGISSDPVNRTFFSSDNINFLQRYIRDVVKAKTGTTIGRQSDDDLKTMMYYFYATYGKNSPKDVPSQVKNLNNMVIADAVPIIVNNMYQYVGYIRDSTTLPVPLEYGKISSVKGQNSLRLPTGI